MAFSFFLLLSTFFSTRRILFYADDTFRRSFSRVSPDVCLGRSLQRGPTPIAVFTPSTSSFLAIGPCRPGPFFIKNSLDSFPSPSGRSPDLMETDDDPFLRFHRTPPPPFPVLIKQTLFVFPLRYARNSLCNPPFFRHLPPYLGSAPLTRRVCSKPLRRCCFFGLTRLLDRHPLGFLVSIEKDPCAARKFRCFLHCPRPPSFRWASSPYLPFFFFSCLHLPLPHRRGRNPLSPSVAKTIATFVLFFFGAFFPPLAACLFLSVRPFSSDHALGFPSLVT